MTKFFIQQEFDNEPVYIVDEFDDDIVTIEATSHLTPEQRAKLARVIVDELKKMED